MKLLALRLVLVLVAAIAFLASGTQAKASLVQNGDFSATSLSSPGGYVCNTVGPTCVSTVSDWSANCSSIGVCGNGGTPLSLLFPGTGGVAFNSFNGLSSPAADAPGGGNTIADDGDVVYRAPVFQTINGLSPGDSYVLTFYQAADQQGGFGSPTTEQWQVSLGAQTQDSTLISDPSGAFTGWSSQSMTFTATSSSEVLNFLALGAPSGVPPIALLADVSLNASPVPEPSYLAVLGGVLGASILWRRWRVRRA